VSTEMMKAVRVHRYGPPESLVYEDVPKPRAGAGQVLIRNEAAGVNFSDIDQRRNTYPPLQLSLPHLLGAEVAGTVEAVGENVTGVAVGDRVFGMFFEPTAYAQYVVASADEIYPLPAEVGYAESTALLVQGLTAYFLLRDGVRLAAGESVLIMAAAGGLGSLAVQLATIMGARQVIGAASTEGKRRLVSELGAHATVDYTQPDWSTRVLGATEGRGVDAVLANVGGDAFHQAIACLAPFGRLSSYGGADMHTPVVDFIAEMKVGRLASNQTLGFFSLYPYLNGSTAMKTALGELTDHVKHNRLRIQLGPQLPLSQAAEMHRLVEERHTTGKCVLLPWAD